MNRQLQKVQHLQSLLADDPELEASFEAACDKLAEVKQYTAETLYRRRPGVYKLITRMIGQSLSVRMISEACGVSPHTVECVRGREGASIEQEKSKLCD